MAERAAAAVPARITMALDLREMYGPEVDLAVGTFEGNLAGDVDGWEAGLAVPSEEQVSLLAALTRFPAAWFYKPIPPGPLTGPVWICYRRKVNGARCHYVQPDWVDERGVLHRGDEDPRSAGATPAVQGALFAQPARVEAPPRTPTPTGPTGREAARAAAAAAARAAAGRRGW